MARVIAHLESDPRAWSAVRAIAPMSDDGSFDEGVIVVRDTGRISVCCAAADSQLHLATADDSVLLEMPTIAACIAYQNPFADHLTTIARQRQLSLRYRFNEFQACVEASAVPESLWAHENLRRAFVEYLEADPKIVAVVNQHEELRARLLVKIEREQLRWAHELAKPGEPAVLRQPLLHDVRALVAHADTHGVSPASIMLGD